MKEIEALKKSMVDNVSKNKDAAAKSDSLEMKIQAMVTENALVLKDKEALLSNNKQT